MSYILAMAAQHCETKLAGTKAGGESLVLQRVPAPPAGAGHSLASAVLRSLREIS